MTEKWTIQLTKRAKKDLEDLQSDRGKALQVLLRLEQNPMQGHPLAGSLRRARALEFSLPGGAYRAAYIVNSDDHVCLVFLVGSHENFYEKAERRYRAF